uniref:Uncharacterized protein n=1 Tax=Saccharolobus solfataricus (strain 98/2) TaxID=555311 RepID=D0KRI1_SACS9
MANVKLYIAQDLLYVILFIINYGVSSPLTAPKKGIV